MLFNLPDRAYASSTSCLYDSLGNTLDTTHPIASIIPVGIYAQTLVETLYPEALLSLAKEVSSDFADFEEAGLADVANLPETGTSRGNFGKTVSVKQIRALNPDLVLQAGFDSNEDKSEMARFEDAEDFQIMYLDIRFGKLPEAYRTLGQVLGCIERANVLAKYIEDAQKRAINATRADSRELRVFYGPRVDGKKVTKGVCIQTEALKALGFEPVMSPYDFKNRTVDFKKLAKEDPGFVLLDDTSFPSKFFSAAGEVYEEWKDLPAISEGRFAVAPALMHSVLGSAVFVQSIGMLWMASVLSYHGCDIDMSSEMQLFYETFYGLKRDTDSLNVLLGNDIEDREDG